MDTHDVHTIPVRGGCLRLSYITRLFFSLSLLKTFLLKFFLHKKGTHHLCTKMPPRAYTRRNSVHNPSSSSLCADPLLPRQQKSSSVLSLAGSGTRRAALSDASNVVVADVTSSRPNHHHRQKRIATTNGRKKNAHRDLDDDVQQKGRRIIAKERKEGVFLLDALLDELMASQ